MPTGSCLLCFNRASCFTYGSLPSGFLRSRAALRLLPRHSTSGSITQLRKLRIRDDVKAREIAAHLRPDERRRLLDALDELSSRPTITGGEMTREQIKQLFLINTVPFLGFGFLDNMVMIVAGEYIDQSLGAWLAISTMAAAALGNLISDVAGVGLAHYVELMVSRFGLKHPVLNSEQLESSIARTTVNLGRAVGLIIGCLIGMFPLLFFDSSNQLDNNEVSKIF